jgi:hypothetical protein
MKMESAAAAKGKGRGNSLSAQSHIKPMEGSRTRFLYDMFMSNKGIPIAYTANEPAKIEALRDYYGLDIRCLGSRRWVLAGEWFGPVYIDYIADKIRKTCP